MSKVQELKIDSEIFENPLYSIQMKTIRYWGLFSATDQKYDILHLMRAYFVVLIVACVPILNFTKVLRSIDNLEDCAISSSVAFLFISISVLGANACIQRRLLLGVVKLVTFLHYDLKNLLSHCDATEEADLQSSIRSTRRITLLLLGPAAVAASMISIDCVYRAIFLPHTVFNVPQIINGTAQPIALHKLLPFGEVYDNLIIGFIFPFYAAFMAVAFVSIGHTFMICLMRYVLLKLRILQNRMRHMDISWVCQNMDEGHNTNTMQDLENSYLQLCQICTDEQNKMRWFVKELEIFLRVPVFVDFIICSIVICFIMYGINSGLLTKIDFIFMCLFMQVILSMLWLYHWHATLIAECNDDLRFAIYSSNWYECPLKVQKSLRLIMTDTLKPLQMRAFFIDMNLNTFLNIIRGAYGYFSILRNVSTN